MVRQAQTAPLPSPKEAQFPHNRSQHENQLPISDKIHQEQQHQDTIMQPNS